MEIEFNSLVVFFVLCLRGNLSNGFGSLLNATEGAQCWSPSGKLCGCIFVDASDFAVGAALLQWAPTGDLLPVEYFSHRLSAAE